MDRKLTDGIKFIVTEFGGRKGPKGRNTYNSNGNGRRLVCSAYIAGTPQKPAPVECRAAPQWEEEIKTTFQMKPPSAAFDPELYLVRRYECGMWYGTVRCARNHIGSIASKRHVTFA